MYFGPLWYNGSVGLIAPMRSTKDGQTNFVYYMACSNTSLNSWASDEYEHDNLNTYGTSIGQFVSRKETYTGRYWYLYFLAYPSTDKHVRYHRYDTDKNSTSSGDIGNTEDIGTTSWLAGCYSPTLGVTLFVSQGGYSIYITNAETGSITAKNVASRRGIIPLSSINPGCAVWIPTTQQFCVSGSQGIALSSDGTNWGGHTGSNIPKNLKDLTWKADISQPCLYAWREEDRKFYKSANALTWVEAGTLPSKSEISTISSVAYNSDYKEYCVIGGTTTYAYFSADLKTWRRTNIVAEG